MKQLIVLLFFIQSLTAALTFNENDQHELTILKTFDIDSTFMNDQVLLDMIERYKTTHRKRSFFRSMDKAYLYIPMMKDILTKSGLPSEFLFLAMAESNFSTKALSSKKASGPWQFMPLTGEVYGLKIDEYVDERRDIMKSTQAAAKYLTALEKRFGKWYLAALAYNCGEGRLDRAIKKAKSNKLEVLLDPKKAYIPKETRLYIRKILTLAIMGSDERYLIRNKYGYLLNRSNTYSIVPIEVPSGERLSRVAKSLNLPTRELIKYNHHLKYDFIPPYGKNYTIYIPYDTLSDFKQNYKPTPLKDIYFIHTVKSGENLSALGRKYRISYKKIMDFNQLKSTRLSLNQRLVIPVNTPPLTLDALYVVKPGDTLISIAKRFQITVAELKEYNELASSMIRIGAKLHVFD
ncbi:MAG: LysM peptidoglycan-binding domain-containing protein [Campylobacterota bacterium]|nr:LysM peptidoglycan-binding domain-containing protein [Campylobacterota bacterium]